MILGLLSIATCKKDTGNEDSTISNATDDLSTEDAEYLDKIEHINYPTYNIMLQNGQSVYDYLNANDPDFLTNMRSKLKSSIKPKGEEPLDYKMVLIARLLAAGSEFIYRDNFNYKAVSGDANAPAQHGLAYSYGQKDYTIREKPPWSGNNCPQKIYGLDCSGLVYQMAAYSELFFPPNPKAYCNADFLSKISNWEQAFKNSKEFKNLSIQAFGQLELSEIETGDIIYWNYPHRGNQVAKHIGIALSTTNGLGAYMSYGNSGSCEANLSDKRGPVQLKLDNRLMKNWFGARTCSNNCTWGVLRVTADLHYFPYNGCEAEFWSRASFNSTKTGNYDSALNIGANMKGTFNFTTFTFNGTTCNVCGKNGKQTLEIIVDLEEHTINKFTWSFIDSTLQYDGKHYLTYKSSVKCVPLKPIQGNYPNYYFNVWGPEVSGYVSEVTYVSTWYDETTRKVETTRLTNLKYDKDTRLEFKFLSKK